MKELPSDFLPLMTRHIGGAQAEDLCHALSETGSSVSIRVNPLKWSCRDVEGQLASWCTDAVPWCPDAFYLQERPAFTFDPLFHAGGYYAQEASSMFLYQALKQYFPLPDTIVPMAVLDLCAAPGGKSTLLRSFLPDHCLLVSNEPIAKRAQVLAENMQKWGHPACMVTRNYPDAFSSCTQVFDLIVADVPCSGEGMFRKDEEAVADWSLQNVDMCARRQRDILTAVWPALKDGGMLVYSTCTFNRFEDEENVMWAARELGAEILPVCHETTWNIVEGNPGYHFFPGRARGEGFYLAVLRKKDTGDVPLRIDAVSRKGGVDKKGKNKGRKTPSVSTFDVQEWLRGDFTVRTDEALSRAVVPYLAPLQDKLRSMLSVLVDGVHVAELKGKEWQPSHALAMSTFLCRDAFPCVELTYAQALSYLRHECICVDAPRGYVLVTFRSVPLGFVKNLGTRANNLYPMEWRIRSGYTTVFTLGACVETV